MGQRKSSKNACIGVLLCLLAAIPLGSLAAGTQGRKGGPSQASPTMPRPGDAALGQGKADAERCIECHGADGQGQGHSNGPEGKFARLAGQQAAYIVKQIQDFRSGARKHDQMAIMARSITDEDAADIAATSRRCRPCGGTPATSASSDAGCTNRAIQFGAYLPAQRATAHEARGSELSRCRPSLAGRSGAISISSYATGVAAIAVTVRAA